jgi:ribose 5-phosphate isomerase B
LTFFFGKFVPLIFDTPLMKISIGNDHAGPDYKKAIVQYLENKGYTVINHGTDTTDSVDYPDFVHPVAQDVENGVVDFGIIICGSGNGVAMTANKYPKVRAALCWIKEISALARQHNDANIISIPARYTSVQQAIDMVDTFLNTPFEGGRHQGRVDKISC